jgi:hypothetical protein
LITNGIDVSRRKAQGAFAIACVDDAPTEWAVNHPLYTT